MRRFLLAVVALLVSFVFIPSAVMSQEAPVARFYVLPIEQVGNARGPEYLSWRFDQNPIAELAGIQWSMKDYGAVNTGIVAANVTAAQHAILAAQPGVISIPANLDEQVGAARVVATRAAVESLQIPGDWIQDTHTYRQIARYVTGLFLYAQRVTAISGGQPILRLEDNLDVQFRNLPLNIRTAMIQAAAELQYDTSDILATNTLRVVLRKLADEWRDPIHFGFIDL